MDFLLAKYKRENKMQGTITKKHFLIILKEFGLKKAIKILFSQKPVALTLLMEV